MYRSCLCTILVLHDLSVVIICQAEDKIKNYTGSFTHCEGMYIYIYMLVNDMHACLFNVCSKCDYFMMDRAS